MFVLEESVEQANTEEEGLVVTLEVGEDLNHPVNHASAQGWSDFVYQQGVLGVELGLELTEVQVDAFSILTVNVYVLTFNFGGFFAAQVS